VAIDPDLKESPSPDELLPELNVFFLTGSRHDKDRVEIQIGFDGLVARNKGTFVYDVDCLLFVPKTLGLTEVSDNHVLRTEFQSYIRLHTHVTNPQSETSETRVRNNLRDLKSQLSVQSLRFFAIEFEGFLKAQKKRFKKRVAPLGQLLGDFEAIQFLMADFRQILKTRNVDEKRINDLARGTIDHDLLALSEYLSHVYVQFMSEIYYALHTIPEVSQLVKAVEDALKSECELRRAMGLLIEEHHGPDKSQEEDKYLRRISLLKKYFQSTLFVASKGQALEKRLQIPVYALSAALAASWAIMVQIYQARTLAERVGINSIALIGVGVAAYVFKDLMKDFFRKYFLARSSNFFPSYQRELLLNNLGKHNRIGRIKEYLRQFDAHDLPVNIRKERYSNFGGELEEYLDEDVLHFKKRVELNLASLRFGSEFPWGIREILRYRLDRLTISMEDAFKKNHVVSSSGLPNTRQSHRIYHVHLAVWIYHSKSSKDEVQVKPAFKAFQITLDKSGVIACKQAPWNDNTPHPSYDAKYL
jgi:hypothetical protein